MENQNISDPTQKMNISIEIIAHIFSVLNNKSNEYVKKKLRAHGYSIVVPNHGPVLKEIQDVEEGITVKELSERLIKPKSTITEMLNKLEKLGYVERHRDVVDGRLVRLKLTEEGQKLNALMFLSIREHVNELLKDFTSEDKDELLTYLVRIYRKI